jgi:hypothetical protein
MLPFPHTLPHGTRDYRFCSTHRRSAFSHARDRQIGRRKDGGREIPGSEEGSRYTRPRALKSTQAIGGRLYPQPRRGEANFSPRRMPEAGQPFLTVTFTHLAAEVSKAVPALQALQDLSSLASVTIDEQLTHLPADASQACAFWQAVAD